MFERANPEAAYLSLDRIVNFYLNADLDFLSKLDIKPFLSPDLLVMYILRHKIDGKKLEHFLGQIAGANI